MITGLGYAILLFVTLVLILGDPASSQFQTVALILLFWLGFVLAGGAGEMIEVALRQRGWMP